MRATLAVAATAALLSPLVTPAAQAADAMTCTLRYDNGGLAGITQGRGTCGNGYLLAFTASNACPQQSVQGTATNGFVSFSFTWQRVGTTGAVTTNGDTNGAGVLTFSSPCPAQNETMVAAYGP
ncbi:MAG TPA: hypothetical protein VNQ77_01315 [Frankiaceae bacterium]|nr:hypothetical protein [Frankiaceae bacterium]